MVALCAISTAATAQGAHPPLRIADSSVARILAEVRSNHINLSGLGALLRQSNGPQPGSKLDELADSLTQHAMTSHDDLAFATPTALAESNQDGFTTQRTEVPYAAALDHLIQIEQGASDLDVRLSVLDLLPMVRPNDRAIDYLRRVATSPFPDRAPAAMESLVHILLDTAGVVARGTTAQSRATTESLLRALWDTVSAEIPKNVDHPPGYSGRPAVPDFQAWSVLAQYARFHGWER